MPAQNQPSPYGLLHWFDPRQREPGNWAFSLNRLTALGLTFYLYLHLIVLRKLAQGPEAFDSFVQTARSPLFILGELAVVFGGLYHGLNGLRVALTSFGVGVGYQKAMFYTVLALSVLATILFGYRMFTV